MAPEVLGAAKMTRASDVYSFAVLLLELWSGCASYTDQNYYGVSLRLKLCNSFECLDACGCCKPPTRNVPHR